MISFIECCYLDRVTMRPDGEAHTIKWGSDKSCYTSRTSTTVFDFQHFSMHDESHSISILKYIELLLGRHRIQEHMSMGDLWLLLQCAYFHDIGMTLTREEMEELWTSDEDFRKYIRGRLQEGSFGGNIEMFQAASFYKLVDDMLNDRKTINLLDETVSVPQDNWPVELCTKLRLLVTDYIRRHHAERSQRFFDQIIKEDKRFLDGVVDRRLYTLVADISSQHTKNFNAVLQLPYEEIAFGDEHIHPRFVAALLRIGDVLDIDNNRFNVRVLEHHGILPELSRLHLEKHHALTHFNITPQQIYAVAVSSEFAVCQETRTWFNWVEEEERALVYSWNQIAPPNMLQCYLSECDMTVYLKKDKNKDTKGELFTAQNTYHFNFDSRKMYKLLIGDNIYDCRLDCLREYLQNAIDASKVQLWQNLQEENAQFLLRSSGKRWHINECLPCDFKEEAFMQLPIEVSLSLKPPAAPSENDQIRITIRDYGIGMDEECIKGITTIGQGWRAREAYNDVFERAPQWMRPTGGFGIGIQSAFMVTSKVSYTTRSAHEPNGHYIELVSPSHGGGVSRRTDNTIPHGTEVTFDIDVFKFLDPTSLRLPEDLNRKARADARRFEYPYFTTKMIFETVAAICERYILSQISNSIFPIFFRRQDATRQLIPAPMFYQTAVDTLKMNPFKAAKEELYKYCYYAVVDDSLEMNATGSKIVLWSRENMDCVTFTFWDDDFQRPSSSMVSFKNVTVPKACGSFPLPNVDYHFDVMGQQANQCLQVSRTSFTREFEEIFQQRCRQYLKIALDILIPEYLEKKMKEADPDPSLAGKGVSTVFPSMLLIASDFVRMLFCRLGLFALPTEKALAVREQLMGIGTWGMRILNEIYVIGKEESQRFKFRPIRYADSNPVRESIRWLERVKREEGETYIVFLLSQQKMNSFDDSEFFLDCETAELPDRPLSDAELAGLCWQLEKERANKAQAQTICDLTQRINHALCCRGNHRRFVFPDGWQKCLLELCLDTYETTTVVVGKPFWGDKPMPYQYLTAIIYTRKEKKDPASGRNGTGMVFDDNWSYVQVVVDNEDLKRDYPELMVTAIPCETSYRNEYRWIHLLLGEAVISKLEKKFNKDPAMKQMDEEDIRSVLRDIPEFVRLTRWTYQHQAKGEGESFRKCQAIENAYVRWVVESLKQKLRAQ